MPTFKITANGETYTVEAPTEDVALQALGEFITEEEDKTNLLECHDLLHLVQSQIMGIGELFS